METVKRSLLASSVGRGEGGWGQGRGNGGGRDRGLGAAQNFRAVKLLRKIHDINHLSKPIDGVSLLM